MASGARLRSDNAASGRSRSGAFLITAAPPEPPVPCSWIINAGATGLGPTAGPVAVSDSSCTCSTRPGSFETRADGSLFRYRGGTGTLGMGWEDPPHPGLLITGQQSGAQVGIAQHCARRCPSDPTNENFWGRYSENPGGTGCDFFVDQSSTNEDDLPVSAGLIHALYKVEGPRTPFILDEECLLEIFFDSATLPDPGPFNILSVRPHRFQANESVFELDAPPRFTSAPAVYIQGTNSYNGMQAGREWGDDFQHGPNDLTVKVPFVAAEAGTLLRIYDLAPAGWDCWHNSVIPVGPEPPLPPAPT